MSEKDTRAYNFYKKVTVGGEVLLATTFITDTYRRLIDRKVFGSGTLLENHMGNLIPSTGYSFIGHILENYIIEKTTIDTHVPSLTNRFVQ